MIVCDRCRKLPPQNVSSNDSESYDNRFHYLAGEFKFILAYPVDEYKGYQHLCRKCACAILENKIPEEFRNGIKEREEQLKRVEEMLDGGEKKNDS